MKRKKHSNKLKAKIALEAIKGESTMSEISSKFGIHSSQILRWKKQVLEFLPDIFSKPSVKKEEDVEKDELYKKIGQLNIELDWLKKKSGFDY